MKDYDRSDVRIGAPCNCGGSFTTVVAQTKRNGVECFNLYCSKCRNKLCEIPHAIDAESLYSFQMPFGKFKGKTLDEIYAHQPDYLNWLLNNLEKSNVLKRVQTFLDSVLAQKR